MPIRQISFGALLFVAVVELPLEFSFRNGELLRDAGRECSGVFTIMFSVSLPLFAENGRGSSGFGPEKSFPGAILPKVENSKIERNWSTEKCLRRKKCVLLHRRSFQNVCFARVALPTNVSIVAMCALKITVWLCPNLYRLVVFSLLHCCYDAE